MQHNAVNEDNILLDNKVQARSNSQRQSNNVRTPPKRRRNHHTSDGQDVSNPPEGTEETDPDMEHTNRDKERLIVDSSQQENPNMIIQD